MRLKAKRFVPPRRPAADSENGGWGDFAPSRLGLMKRLRAIRRGLSVLIWTLLCLPVEVPLLLLPGRAKARFAQTYWSGMCRLIGLKVQVIGAPAAGDRPIVFVSNHSSWLDILVLGGRLEACFVAKEEVARWPLIGTIARLGRTVFVRRSRASTLDERDDMQSRLSAGDSLILFPESTTSDGSRVMPFHSAFLSVTELPATADGRRPIVQPVSVVYDRLAWLPIGRASRPVFAWYGDMDFASHFWRLAQHPGLRATVLLHAPLDPASFASRKALARAVWSTVADGAATLRQNRPARPLAAGGQAGFPDPAEAAPIFA
jgi:1-acyl-sn-glycerol-3-phosphate acyltransferase